MALPNIFTQQVSEQVIERIGKLTPNTTPQWGKMNAAQMLAHCNVPYEMVYESIHPKPNAFMVWLISLMAKDTVVSEKPYPRNTRTAPAFLIKGEHDFEKEKSRVISYITRTQQLGEGHFDQKLSNSFGKLSITEWNNMFYKHLDHHLTQFGV